MSPCIQVCRVQDGHCVGCGRTLDQIRDWSRLSEAEKLKIIKSLPGDP